MKKFFLEISRFKKTPFIIFLGALSIFLVINLLLFLAGSESNIFNVVFFFIYIFIPGLTIVGAIVSVYQIFILKYYWSGIISFFLNCIGPAMLMLFIVGIMTGEIIV